MKKVIAYLCALSVLVAGCALAATNTNTNASKSTNICANYQKLNQQQKDEVNKIVNDNIKQLMPLHQKLMADFETLHQQIMQTPVDEDAVNKTVDDIIAVKGQIFKAHVKVAIQIEKKYGFIPMCCTMKGHCPKMKEGVTRQSDLEAMMMACQKDPTCNKK
jgi:hypothetical protein